MTVKINFKINPDTKKLDISIDSDVENENQQELDMAKRILGLSTQLNFVDLPVGKGFDVGASIIVETENYHDEESYYDDYDEDNFDEEESPFINRSDSFEASSIGEFSSDIINKRDESEIEQTMNFSKTQKEIQEFISENRSIGWKHGEEYVNVYLDIEDASKVIGGLTSPTSIATMMVYELLKRTINKVEKYV